jgi:4-hydroxy-2-oxoheptanedioate aldolase
MAESVLKRKLEQGQPVVVVSGENHPDIIDHLGPLGFDAAWVDTEHGPFTWKDLSDISRACDLWGMQSLVRVTTNDPPTIMRTLDRGINGVVVPHVNTKEEAQRVVDGAKYHPIGHRGVGGARQGYGKPDYIHRANGETFLVAMIEDIVAVNNLPEILSVEHIDVFFIARHDLAQSMGHLGQPGHPEVIEAADRALAQIVAAGRIAGSTASTDTIEQQLDKGLRFLMISWLDWVRKAGAEYLDKVKAYKG